MKQTRTKIAIAAILLFVIQGCSKEKPSDEQPTETKDKIKVETSEVSQIASRFALVSYNALNDDNTELKIETGVCYGTNGTPTINDNTMKQASDKTGFFSLRLSGLGLSTKYYARAYAKYDSKVIYGNILSFTTLGVAQLESVKIGTQTWSKKNLDVEVFKNGEDFTVGGDRLPWYQTNSPRFTYYQNNLSYKNTYGLLYNYYAVIDPRGLAPEGWHIPSDAEWKILIDYLGGEAVAGGKMKAAGFDSWNAPNTGATNSSGFTALGGSGCNQDGVYPYSLKSQGTWWSSTPKGFNGSTYNLTERLASIYQQDLGRLNGGSVRLIKD